MLAIDPSIINLGFAIIGSDSMIYTVSTIRQLTPAKVEYQQRSVDTARTLMSAIFGLSDSEQDYGPMHVAIESPSNWSSERGQASKDKESIQKLYHLTGAIVAAVMLARTDTELSGRVYVISPMAWKGQAPKPVMIERACKIVDLEPHVPHDACEALLLAFHALKHIDFSPRPIRGMPYSFLGAGRTSSFVVGEWLAGYGTDAAALTEATEQMEARIAEAHRPRQRRRTTISVVDIENEEDEC